MISDVIWVGGMFLAYIAVRPRPGSAGTAAAPAFVGRHLPALFPVGVGGSRIDTRERLPDDEPDAGVAGLRDVMTVIGLVMSAIFLHIYFAPFGRLKRAVASEDWKAGGAALNQIRILVATNLVLGLVNIAVAVLGRGFA